MILSSKTIRIPRTGTPASRSYYNSYSSINSFFNFLMQLVGYADRVRKIAGDALKDVAETDDEKEKRGKNQEKPGPIDMLRQHRQQIIEIILVRHVEAYLNYLSGVLFEIFTQRPETLRSSEKVEVADILQHDTVKDIVQDLAQRKVDSLAYSSFDTLRDFFRDRFNLEIAQPDVSAVITEAIETRNISVHNHCLINERYVNRTGTSPNSIGTLRRLGIGDLDNVIPLLVKSVTTLDKMTRKKLGLKGVRFSSQESPDGE